MAQLAGALLGHVVPWHADKRVVCVRAFLLLAVSCFKLSGHWRSQDRSSCRCEKRAPLGPMLFSLFKTDRLVIASVALTEN